MSYAGGGATLLILVQVQAGPPAFAAMQLRFGARTRENAVYDHPKTLSQPQNLV